MQACRHGRNRTTNLEERVGKDQTYMDGQEEECNILTFEVHQPFALLGSLDGNSSPGLVHQLGEATTSLAVQQFSGWLTPGS